MKYTGSHTAQNEHIAEGNPRMYLMYSKKKVIVTTGNIFRKRYVVMLSGLWERLSNLEYIGQHKESLIVAVREAGERSEPRRSYFVE